MVLINYYLWVIWKIQIRKETIILRFFKLFLLLWPVVHLCTQLLWILYNFYAVWPICFYYWCLINFFYKLVYNFFITYILLYPLATATLFMILVFSSLSFCSRLKNENNKIKNEFKKRKIIVYFKTENNIKKSLGQKR